MNRGKNEYKLYDDASAIAIAIMLSEEQEFE